MNNLAYLAADTLGTTLYQVQATLKGSEVRTVRLGPWKIPLLIESVSDLVITGKEITFFVTIVHRLRAYVIVRDTEAWLLILDAEKLRTAFEASGMIGDTVRERILEIKPAIKGVFQWSDQSPREEEATGQWRKLNVEHLL